MLKPEVIAERLKPGVHPEGKHVTECLPCGKADGVIYFGAGREATPDAEGNVEVKDVPSLEREAMRYLKPMSPMWRALNNMQIGVASPHGIEPIFTREILEKAKLAGRQIEWMFTCEECGIYAANPKFMSRWRIFEVQNGIWAVLLN